MDRRTDITTQTSLDHEVDNSMDSEKVLNLKLEHESSHSTSGRNRSSSSPTDRLESKHNLLSSSGRSSSSVANSMAAAALQMNVAGSLTMNPLAHVSIESIRPLKYIIANSAF